MAFLSVEDCSLQCRIHNTFLDFKVDFEFETIPRALSADNLQKLQGQKASYNLFVPCHHLQLQQARETQVTGPNHIEEYSCAMPYPEAHFNVIKGPVSSSKQDFNDLEEVQHTCIPSAISCQRKSPRIDHENPTDFVQAHLRVKDMGLSMVQKNWDWSEFNLEGTGVDIEEMQFSIQTNLKRLHGNATKSSHKCVQATDYYLPPSMFGEVTTLLVRNVVCSYTDQEILQILDAMGLKGKYDFIYVPKGSSNQANFGYFFLNLKSPEYVKECEALILGRRFGPRKTHKLCEVRAADLQGIDLITHIQRKRVKRGFVPTITWPLK